jgi:hypothetical protein
MNGRTKNFKGLHNINFKCSTPAVTPMFGVYTEYPVCLDKKSKKIIGLDVTWDNYSKNSSFKPKAKHGIPSKYEIKKCPELLTVLHIFDVAVLDGEKLAYIFEIKHTHAVDAKKIKFSEKHKIPMYEVAAQWVLEKVIGKIPWDLQFIASYGGAVVVNNSSMVTATVVATVDTTNATDTAGAEGAVDESSSIDEHCPTDF